jgi:hypothetical protein
LHNEGMMAATGGLFNFWRRQGEDRSGAIAACPSKGGRHKTRDACTESFFREIRSNEERQRLVDARRLSNRKELRFLEAVDFLEDEEFAGILDETDQTFGANDLLRQIPETR